MLDVHNSAYEFPKFTIQSFAAYIFSLLCPKLYLLEKWFPLQGERAHSLYFWSFSKTK